MTRLTAVVCTRDRPGSLRRALDTVLAQIGPDDEVVVVDDASDPPVRLVETDVRVIRTPGVGPAGARAAGLAAARGTYLAWCDDDDEWLPGHVEKLLGLLDADDATGLVYGDAELTVDGSAGAPSVPYSLDFERYVLSEWNYLPVSAVVHRVDLARKVGGFDARLSAFEDWDLWLRLIDSGARIRHLAATVTRQHWHPGSHTESGKGEYWKDAEQVQVRHRSRTDRPRTPFVRKTWTEGRELVCHALMRPYEGYGVVGRNLLMALESRGVKISLAPEDDQHPAGTEKLQRQFPGHDRLALYYDYRSRPREMGCDRVVFYTMCESTDVGERRLLGARSSDYVLVPCQQNADAFRAAGITAPIGVVHHGIDPETFPHLDRPQRDTFTFGTFGHLSPRKGTDVLIRAFLAEFGREEQVRLILKSTVDSGAYNVDDPRIRVISRGMDAIGLIELLRGFDALVLPSRGEGFGLCGLEGMATGLPVIATAWSGPAEYLDAADSLPLSYRLVEAAGVESNGARYYGQWAEPDVEHLRTLLRWLFEHPAEAAAMGRQASARVHRDWTWARAAADLEQHLDAAAQLGGAA